VDVSFRSVRSTYNSQVGVMHAADVHTAILMGVAEVLAGMRSQLPGTQVHLPARGEGAPAGEEAARR
jgi:amidohydrolase